MKVLLSKLLQNAGKDTGPNDDDWIELGVVEDEGEGPIYHRRDTWISFYNADSELISKAYRRLHTRSEYSGGGLGLARVARIVRRDRRRVWADGGLGGGAVFRFTLGSSS